MMRAGANQMLQIKRSLQRWWEKLTMSDEERYLHDSPNIIVLEHRIRNLLSNPYHKMKGT